MERNRKRCLEYSPQELGITVLAVCMKVPPLHAADHTLGRSYISIAKTVGPIVQLVQEALYRPLSPRVPSQHPGVDSASAVQKNQSCRPVDVLSKPVEAPRLPAAILSRAYLGYFKLF
ncbi:uncharacterized protein ARMOST_12775 [Armillaria ostoyae]|uniref:Uncharacterized protein n=1 Tax=Armillaria ostoyae TaxID=47428 RepID=A0A284RKW4_ARMOS|nr:uncharacterized protein ARMOST_12775 [Armillaria ostoyae]